MTEQAPQPAARKAGLQTILRFLPLLWPKGEGELKARVIAAMLLVLAGKAVGLTVPYALKWVVDAMSGAKAAPTLVLAMVAAYAAARFGTVLTDNLRNAVFEKVGQQAGRRLAARAGRALPDPDRYAAARTVRPCRPAAPMAAQHLHRPVPRRPPGLHGAGMEGAGGHPPLRPLRRPEMPRLGHRSAACESSGLDRGRADGVAGRGLLALPSVLSDGL